MTEIFLDHPDSRVRLKAGLILLPYADGGLKLHQQPLAKERAYDEITLYIAPANMRRLWEQRPEQTLIVEPAEEETEPLVEVAAGAEPASGEDEVPEPDEPATAEVSLVAEARSTQPFSSGCSEFPDFFQRSTAACRSNPERECVAGNLGQWDEPALSHGGV